jgi:hypothetical protein
VNRRDFQLLSAVRLKEAKALLEAGFPDGAYYLAGYSVECALKACIAKRTNRHDFPDKKRANESYTHNLTQLVITAKLEAVSEHLKKIHSSTSIGGLCLTGQNLLDMRQTRIKWP